MARSTEYRSWSHLIDRCCNPSDKAYAHYGGRGISVCAEWKESFEAFFAHVGAKPSAKHSIDRINNDGNYEPGNVRWATATQQARNKRRPPRRTHCKRGHPFDVANTYWVTTADGEHQSCRVCRQIAESKRPPRRVAHVA